jgi:cell division protein YceG involved in septum cleavage
MAGAKRGCLFVVTLVVVLAAVVAGAGAWFFYQQTRFADAPITPTAESVVIASGDGMNSVLRKLRDAGVDEGQDTQWQLLARQLDAAGKLKVGEYALSGELTRASCCCACAPARCCSTASPLSRAGTSASCVPRSSAPSRCCTPPTTWMTPR